MLRSVCLKNFVKFKEQQILDFRDDSPFIFIGENCSGKSSVIEGIRRCLTHELSTSLSSSFDSNLTSYFISAFESQEKEHIICGIVVLPETIARESNSNAEGQKIMTDRGENQKKSYYKFVMKYKADSPNETMYVNLVEITETGENEKTVTPLDGIEGCDLRKKLVSVLIESSVDREIEDNLWTVFNDQNTNTSSKVNDCEDILKSLSKEVVFTFPLRSIGPLQWSESSKIAMGERESNYKEAESRCEIIKYFLEGKNESKFDKTKEQRIFRIITQTNNYHFELNAGRISLPKGKYALLKTPEGILEAKAFSILMSSNTYRTIVLEEPDRGMHPQFIERMLQVIRRCKTEKRIILTTHNKTFVTPWTVSACFIFRHQDEGCVIISGKSVVGTNMKQMRLLTSDHVSDILFAKKVLFYKSDSEMMFLTELKHQLLAEENIELVFHGDDKLKHSLMETTFINMNGKCNFDSCKEICDKLQLKYITLVDRDAVPDIRKKGKTKDERKKETEASKNRTRDEWRDIRNEFKEERHAFFWLDGTLEQMLNAMSTENELYDEQEQQSQNSEKLLGERQELREKIKRVIRQDKLFLHDGIESKDVRECVKLVLKCCKKEHDLFEFIKFLRGDGKDAVNNR